jgi:hypothetical protein
MKLKDITALQWVGIVILFNTTLLGSASQLGDLSLSAGAVKAILAVATIGNGFLGGFVTMFGGAQALKDTVGAMGNTVVVTTRESADALPNNPDVIGMSAHQIATIKRSAQ